MTEKSNICKVGATPCRCGKPAETEQGGELKCKACACGTGTKCAVHRLRSQDERLDELSGEFD